jgi:heavy metal translocating P-type ATPase
LQRLADRYAVWFVPATLIIAGTAGFLAGSAERALAVLVVATPCPLLLAAPIAIISGVSRAAHRGIVVKGGGAIETLARVRSIFLDKTGTLTRGAPELQRIALVRLDDDEHEILALAASLEQLSSHVFAGAVVRAARLRDLELTVPERVEESHGAGVEGYIRGHAVRIGSFDWVVNQPASRQVQQFHRRLARGEGSVVYVAVDGALRGALVFDDPIRPDAPRAIRALKAFGVSDITMLTGDRAGVAESVGAALGVDHVFAELTPADKLRAVTAAGERGVTLMVGDGINDAPALAAADVGVAMGARGATSSSEAADVVLVVDRLDRLVEAVRIARRTRAIAVESIILGMSLSFIAMGFAAVGLLPPVWGALLQEGIDAIAILSALRALRGPREAGNKFQLPPDLAAALRREHQELRPTVDRLRRYVQELSVPGSELLPATVAELRSTLATIIAHERDDELHTYRVISRGMKGADPLAGMSRTHQEIFHLGGVIERLLIEVEEDPNDFEDLVDLRRAVGALDVLFRLNIAQEEELYFSLDPDYSGPVAA